MIFLIHRIVRQENSSASSKYGKFERHGITIAFWEPARLVETVKDPYCFPALGMKMENNSSADLSGCTSSMGNEESMTTFAQAHYYIFPAWRMLEERVNDYCFEESGSDLAYITEVDALWNDDLLSALITPEAYLFANLRLQLLCIADSVSANAWLPLAPLFWCMGS
ncbi:MAG: TraU family protein, partial [Deltaproteobacteria bacterium]|nr:TraU family protein [Deltaproteobacteria bacterium]